MPLANLVDVLAAFDHIHYSVQYNTVLDVYGQLQLGMLCVSGHFHLCHPVWPKVARNMACTWIDHFLTRRLRMKVDEVGCMGFERWKGREGCHLYDCIDAELLTANRVVDTGAIYVATAAIATSATDA
jgi:hypothetical protein